MNITSQSAFSEYLSILSAKQKETRYETLDENNVFETQVDNLKIDYINLSWFCVGNVKFSNCVFTKCQFDDIEFNGIELNNCIFENCTFQQTVFMDCTLAKCAFLNPFSNTLSLRMTSLEDVQICNCDLQYVIFSDCGLQNVNFERGAIYNCKYESGDFYYAYKSRLSFKNINLQSIIFSDLDLTQTVFDSCNLNVAFINSKLSSGSIINCKPSEMSNIDLATIRNSDSIPEIVLKDNFGIKDKNIKELIEYLTSNKYHSVFISYSFIDAVFVRGLNGLLKENGVKTFFWQDDAPGARKMKKIMSENIRDFEKFLFVASKNSLKSGACHYEIGVARRKYYQSWEEIFIPIHLDNFLFNIKKEDIPKKYRNIYWRNITEIKEFNSIDFTSFLSPKDLKSSRQYRNLLNSLKGE